MKNKPLKVLSDGLFFNQSERRAAFLLSALVVLLCIIPFVYDSYFRPASKIKLTERVINQLEKQPEYQYTNNTKSNASNNFAKKSTQINRDLNTCEWKDLVNAGVDKKVAGKLLNYRKAIKGFKSYNDLLKVYTITSNDIDLIKKNFGISYKDAVSITANDIANITPEKKQIVNINSSDSIALLKIKGLGPYYVGKILKYRRLLGGFTNINQLKEIYYFPDSIYIKIAPQIDCNGAIDELNINTLSQQELAKHPYINYKTARLIDAYRIQHGKIKNIEELKIATKLNNVKLNLLESYITF